MLKTFEISLDLETQTAYSQFSVSQGDLNSIALTLTLNQDGKPVDLTGCTVRMVVRKPSGKTIIKDCPVITPKSGICSVLLGTQASVEIGTYTAELYIYAGDSVAVTGVFTYTSRATILNDEYVESTNDWQAINEAIGEAREILDYLESNGTGIDAQAREDIEAVNEELFNKADKGNISILEINKNLGKLDQSYLSEELLAQIAGTAQINAVVGSDGVTSSKVAPKAIRKYHLDFTPLEGLPSKNLINPNTIALGKYVRYATGETPDNVNWGASDFIRIKGSTNYTVNFGDQIAFYDKDQVYVSGVEFNTNIDSPHTLTTPSNAYYLRLGIPQSKISTAQLEEGSSFTGYEEYGNYKVNSKTKINNDNIDNKTIALEKISESGSIPLVSTGKNLFDKSKVTVGKYVRWNIGTLGDNASYSVSDYTELKPDTSYVVNYGDQIAFFDKNLVYISGINLYQVATLTFVTPSNAKFVRFTLPNSKVGSFQFEAGTVSTPYEAYYRSLSEDIIPALAKSAKTTQQIISQVVLSDSTKKVKLIGDSITHGVGGTGFAQDGEVIYSTFKVNTSGYCWANLMKAYWESKFNCTVTNYGTTGRNSYDLLTNIQTLVKSDDDIVICMIGTNDRNNETRDGVLNSKSTLYNNLKGIVDYVRNQGKEIILMSNIPASVTNETSGKLFNMEDVDHVVMKVANEKGVPHISVYKQFIKYCEQKNVTIDSLLTDGLHPNNSGYDVMFNIISNELGVSTKRAGATW